MAKMNYSKTILEMGNRQLQLFLKGIEGSELNKLIYCINEHAQDRIFKNMSIKAVTYLQTQVEKLKNSDELPQISEETTLKLLNSYQEKTDIKLPDLKSNYSINELITYIIDLRDYFEDNGYSDLELILDNINAPVLKQLVKRLTKYDNIIEFEIFLDILLERRIEEIKIENKIIRHGFLQLFSGESTFLISELQNILPFGLQNKEEKTIYKQKFIIDAKEIESD